VIPQSFLSPKLLHTTHRNFFHIVNPPQYSNPADSPGGAPTIDAEAVARAKREIQGLIQEIAELSRTDVTPEAFYDALLNRVVTALAAVGGAVWTVADNGGLQLVYQINFRHAELAENQVAQMQHARLLHQVLEGTEGALVAPHSGHAGESDDDESTAANPTEFLLVLGPIHNDQGAQGVVEVFQRPGARAATQRGYLRFLLQACELASDFLRGRRLRHLSDKQLLWEQLESFTRLAHEKLEVRQTAYTIANEGRRLIGCDRVSIAIQRGQRCPIEAISGQDAFDKRSNVTVLLGKLAHAVTRTGEDVWYTGDTSNMAPQVEQALETYVDESHTKAMAVLPLFEPRDEEDLRTDQTPPRLLGALIVEQMVDSRPADGFTHRVDVVRSHSSTALNNAVEYEGLFLMPVWKTLGKAAGLFRGRKLPKTLLVIGAAAILVAVAVFVPYEFAPQGDARLRPVERARVFAALNGEIRQVLVTNDQPVDQGQLLVIQESIDLETDIKQTEGEYQEVLEEMRATQRDSDDGRDSYEQQLHEQAAALAGLRVRKETLETRLDLLRQKSEKLKLYSPIAGQVITWELEEKLLGRTVTPGEQLMTVADPAGDWELEISMPESRMRHIQKYWDQSGGDQEVTFILATHPSDRLTGQVVEIEEVVEPHDDAGNAVLIRVTFGQDELRKIVADPKVNAGATAKVHCGEQPVGYVIFHSLIDAFKRHVLFRFG